MRHHVPPDVACPNTHEWVGLTVSLLGLFALCAYLVHVVGRHIKERDVLDRDRT